MLASCSGRQCVPSRTSRISCYVPTHCRPSRRRCATVRSSSQKSDTAQEKRTLEAALKEAVASEDYASAARIKEQLHLLDLQDPLVGLKMALDKAVAEERYQVGDGDRQDINIRPYSAPVHTSGRHLATSPHGGSSLQQRLQSRKVCGININTLAPFAGCSTFARPGKGDRRPQQATAARHDWFDHQQ